MATITALVLAPEGVRELSAVASAVAQREVELETIVVAPEGAEVAALPEAVRVVRVPAGSSPAKLRNAGVAAATGKYVCVIEPGERLEGTDALASLALLLEQDASAAAAYGRTLVEERGTQRARPERGRSGRILRALVQYKAFFASSASVLWRRDLVLKEGYSDSYRTSGGLLLALALEIGRDRSFAFRPATTAVAGLVRDDLPTLEEKVKIFVALLYGAVRLDERIEVRVRFRLARHLVALGKHHYRQGDHTRAGKLFGEAVKAAPSYFKGRRYQFMNFLKGVMSR